MNSVIAAIDESTATTSVLAMATTIAALVGADVEALHVREDDGAGVEAAARAAGVPLVVVDGDPADEIVRALDRPGVALGVIGTRGEPAGPSPAGHVATSVAARCGTPLLVVPPTVGGRGDGTRPVRRALVPLEGSEDSSSCLTDTLRGLADAGVELLAVHVFDASTVPRFWDQPAHAGQSYAREFAARWCEDPPVELRLVSGPAADAVVDAAAAHDVDLIVLGWHRDLQRPERAPVVRAALSEAGVPVLLLAPREPREDGV